MTGTTRQAYIEDLEALRREIEAMGAKVGENLAQAMRALARRDKALATKVMREDDEIDAMNVAVEDRCMLLIARQQPIARDLRIITTGLKISTDLERIGDHAHDIAKIATELEGDSFIKEMEIIPEMARVAGQMLQEAIEAYTVFDVQMAEKICATDDVVDALYAKLFHELSRFVGEDATAARQATQLLFVSRYLERVGDHATNIAEWVIYLVTAERIRKTPKL